MASPEARRKRRRKVKDGFPVAPFNMTKEQQESYFGGNGITCLLCGRSFRSIGTHLSVHNMDERTYKLMYGLPLYRGLTCQSSRDLYSASVKARPLGFGEASAEQAAEARIAKVELERPAYAGRNRKGRTRTGTGRFDR